MNYPLVSIVVPIYNNGDRLRSAIRCVLDQTYKNIEVLLVDDGSTDNSLEVCREAERFDERVRCIRQNNLGSGPARNTGIRNATGKYIYFPDADDELSPELVETAVSRLEDSGADLAVFGFIRALPEGGDQTIRKLDGDIVSGDVLRREYHRYYGFNDPGGIQGAPWNKMFSLGVIRNNNVEYPPMRRHQDEVFIMRYVSVCKRAVFIDRPLYTYHANGADKLFEKFPRDYFDIVSECNKYRKEYMLNFGADDPELLRLVCGSFLDGTCQAMIVTFDPKRGYSARARFSEIKKISERFLKELPDPAYRSDSVLYKLMRGRHYLTLYIAVRLALFKHYGR